MYDISASKHKPASLPTIVVLPKWKYSTPITEARPNPRECIATSPRTHSRFCNTNSRLHVFLFPYLNSTQHATIDLPHRASNVARVAAKQELDYFRYLNRVGASAEHGVVRELESKFSIEGVHEGCVDKASKVVSASATGSPPVAPMRAQTTLENTERIPLSGGKKNLRCDGVNADSSPLLLPCSSFCEPNDGMLRGAID